MHPTDLAPRADWITSDDQLGAWLAPIPGNAVVGVDTEFMRRDTFYPQLALLQLAHDHRYALVDPLAFDAGPRIQALLGAQPTVSVMHSASEDLEALAAFLPRGPHTLFDTQIAAAFAGMGAGLSYRALVAELIGDELDKGETRSDWLQRPLTASQMSYAALDVVHLHRIHGQLSEKLDERGRTAWFQEDCRRLLQRAGSTGDTQPQRSFKGAADWTPDRQALLRRLLRWRDVTARTLNKPRPWLVDDNLAMSLTSNLPHSQDDLDTRARGQRALRSAQRRDIFEMLHEPVSGEEINDTMPIPGHPFGEAKKIIAAMKVVVDEKALEFDVPGGLLCARRNLDDLVVGGEWPEGLQGWRRDVLHGPLMALMPG